ncbi:hypothetical protein Ddye_012016 [Dipteronia dyeriana]|uniref:Uncharacterized protein n=1 Tax=Dipteronia dyeriana TaxID=168575 RepID=A0AAD9X3N2_9ROSI|nr:hypothetical protein Ddye_012016 [Dipteronia dyeriana]
MLISTYKRWPLCLPKLSTDLLIAYLPLHANSKGLSSSHKNFQYSNVHHLNVAPQLESKYTFATRTGSVILLLHQVIQAHASYPSDKISASPPVISFSSGGKVPQSACQNLQSLSFSSTLILITHNLHRKMI